MPNTLQDRLKFRIYNKHAKQYIMDQEGKTAIFDLQIWASYCNMTGLRKLDSLILEQAVTVLDLNKKMIFEGDIVKTDSKHISIIPDATEYTAGEVRYMNEGFFLCQSGVGRVAFEKYVFCDCCPCALEIIGNVHS